MVVATEYKNNDIHVNVEKGPHCHVTLDISVTKDAVKSAYDEAIKIVGQNNKTGNKNGKSQQKYILDNYKDQLTNQWRELIIVTAFKGALPLTNLYPFRNDIAKCTKIETPELNSECKLTIEFETSPKIPSIDLSEITLEKVDRRAITKEDINRALENIQINFALWHEVPNRPIKEGDYVDLDISGAEPPYPEICRGTRFYMKKGKIANWMYKNLIGKKINDRIEVSSESENTSHDIHFEPIKVVIIIKGIKAATLPEMNDELAKKAGSANLLALKERIIGDLNHKSDQEMADKLRQQVDKYLLNNYEFDIPATMIEEEKQARIKNLITLLQRQNVSKDVIDKSVQELEKNLEKNVEQDYRVFFLLNAFAKQHNLQVTKEEIANELAQQVIQYKSNAFIGQRHEEIEAKLGMLLLLRKCHDYIIEHVTH